MGYRKIPCWLFYCIFLTKTPRVRSLAGTRLCDDMLSVIRYEACAVICLQVKTVNYPATQFQVSKLTERKSYMFRVMAENIHGDSEPLITETPTKAENPFGMYEPHIQYVKVYTYMYRVHVCILDICISSLCLITLTSALVLEVFAFVRSC